MASTKKNKTAATAGTAGDTFSIKYGQSSPKKSPLTVKSKPRVRKNMPDDRDIIRRPSQKNLFRPGSTCQRFWRDGDGRQGRRGVVSGDGVASPSAVTAVLRPGEDPIEAGESAGT